MVKSPENSTEINPFLASLSIKPHLKSIELSLKGSGLEEDATFHSVKRVDISKGSWYSGLDLMHLYEYSKPALEVLGYVMTHLRWNQDFIELKPMPVFDPEHPYKLYMKKTSFYTGVSELISRGILANRPKRIGTYWIDPAKFFLGDRLKAFKDYVVMPSKSASSSDEESNIDNQ